MKLGERLKQYLASKRPSWPEEGVSPVFLVTGDESVSDSQLLAFARHFAVRLSSVDLDNNLELIAAAMSVDPPPYTPAAVSVRMGASSMIVRIDTDGLHSPALLRVFVQIFEQELGSLVGGQIELYDPDKDMKLWNESFPIPGSALFDLPENRDR